MLNGFEEQTASLTPEELLIADYIASRIRGNIGENMAVTSSKIITAVRKQYNSKFDGPRLRKVINYIRMTGMVKNLIATSKGYYIETDPDKINQYVESLMQRAKAIIAVAKQYQTT
jgi:predicted secreted Zn-dependent protease